MPDAPPLVLIVDDNARNRKLACDVLLAAGSRVMEAASGGEGMALAGEHVPDVILMDLRLPDMEGIDAARQLAAGERTAAIAIVAFSSLPLDGEDAWLRDAGFVGSIAKPIDVRTFPDQVLNYCRS